MTTRIIVGDCRATMRGMEEASVDAVVCDPPYELGFMGKRWDRSGVAFAPATWAATLRPLKPGGYLLAFSGSRTYHRMVCAIEDAGFEIRDQILWLYGSGFPKSHNGEWGGTALKPAHEPIVVARKPLEGTVAENWRKWGTGALNIDGCRVTTEDDLNGGAYSDSGARASSQSLNSGGMNRAGATAGCEFVQPVGRWPANIIHDGSDEVLAAFPDAPGQQGVAKNDGAATGNAVYGKLLNVTANPEPRKDSGSAARFFYCAKASKRDREEGLEAFEPAKTNDGRTVDADNAYQRGASLRKNTHPTVKPTDLMRYLCRLVAPAGGLILDPFAGSGSTGKAAVLEGFRFLGCELSAVYAAIATARINQALYGDLA